MTKKNRKKVVKVVEVKPHVKPGVHELKIHVHSEDTPPPLDAADAEMPPTWPPSGYEDAGLGAVRGASSADTTPESKPATKKGIWHWLTGD